MLQDSYSEMTVQQLKQQFQNGFEILQEQMQRLPLEVSKEKLDQERKKKIQMLAKKNQQIESKLKNILQIQNLEQPVEQLVDFRNEWHRNNFQEKYGRITKMSNNKEFNFIMLKTEIGMEDEFVFYVKLEEGSQVMVGVADQACINNQDHSLFQSSRAISYDCHNGTIIYKSVYDMLISQENEYMTETTTKDRVRVGMALRVTVKRKQEQISFQVKDPKGFSGKPHKVQHQMLGDPQCTLVPYFELRDKWTMIHCFIPTRIPE